jgi:hypothetical protein
VTETQPSVFEMRAVVPAPADQSWFWTERCQQMWREADQDVAGTRLRGFELARPLLADLDMCGSSAPIPLLLTSQHEARVT